MASSSQDDDAAAAMASTNNKRPREEEEEEDEEHKYESSASVRRVRSLEEEHQPCAKMARMQEGIHNTASWPSTAAVDSSRPAVEQDNKQEPRMPYAPTISDYYAPGGSKRYLPRPEWLAKQQGRVARPNRIRPPSRLEEFLLDAPNFWNPLINELEENQEGPENEEGAQDDVSSVGQVGEEMGDNDEGEEENNNAGGNDDDEDAAGANRPPQNGLLPDDVFQEFRFRPQERPAESPLMLTAAEQQRAPLSLGGPVSVQNSATQRTSRKESETASLETFGDDKNTALLVCIREGSIEAALRLIELGADVNAHNTKGITPLLSSCAKGHLEVVQALVRKGASVGHVASNGANALLQGSHFGRLPVVEYLLSLREGRRLIDRGNNNNTTALMRASQEGHLKICSLLLQHGAEVNRGNREAMNALMLASQRGHSAVVRLLVQYGARLNDKTSTESTALSLACKRGHLSVAKILVGAGCELRHRDNRARTAQHIAIRRLRHAEQDGEDATEEASELVRILTPESQVTLMRQAERMDRNFVMVKLWTLLQQERAFFPGPMGDVSIHEVAERTDVWEETSKSSSALLATMTLPEPMVELIASFLPLSDLWDRRLAMLASQCRVDADMAVHSILDLIDECLDSGGFVEACEAAHVTAPTNFASWADWKAGNRLPDDPETARARAERRAAVSLGNQSFDVGLPLLNEGLHPFDMSILAHNPMIGSRMRPKSAVDRRREVCFLQILAHRSPLLAQVLMGPPYRMPQSLVQKLIAVSDIQSLSRRLGPGGLHFQTALASELVVLASSVVMWYRFSSHAREPEA